METNYKNIDIKELNTYKGSICLYSLNFEENLGDFVTNEFEKLLKGNDITYNTSLASENACSLIIIDADDFNPSKIFGMTKKYENPIVLFVSKESKISKLKSLLIRDVLMIDKNTTKKIDIIDDVNRNIEEKIKREKEKEEKELNNNSKEKPEEIIEETITKEAIKTKNEQKNDIKEEIVIDVTQRDTTKEKIDNVEENKSSKNNTSDELETVEKKPLIEANITNKIIKLDNVAYYTNDIKIIQNLKDIFGKELNQINNFLNEKKDYDILFIDTTYSSVIRLYDFIKSINVCPLIIMGNRKSKINDLISLMDRSVLVLEKPLNIGRDVLYNKVLQYLNSFSFDKKNNEELVKAKSIRERDERIFDNDYEKNLKNSFTQYINRVKADKNTVKEEINRTNKRSDKALSLEYIYEKMGLNNIATFNSQLNKCIYTTTNGKVIKYMPSGYLIEYRIVRLKKKGFSDEQINNTLKKLEESDIKFQKNMLKRTDETKNKSTVNFKEVRLERISYKESKTSNENLFDSKIKKIEENVKKINFNIFNEFKEFIITYRKLKKELLENRNKKKIKSKETKDKEVLVKDTLKTIKKKNTNDNEFEKENKKPLNNSFVKSSMSLNRKRLDAIRDKGQAIKSNNNIDNNIIHRESDVTLNDINQKLPGKTLLEEYNFYELSEINNEKEIKKNRQSAFKSSNVRPPRTDL